MTVLIPTKQQNFQNIFAYKYMNWYKHKCFSCLDKIYISIFVYMKQHHIVQYSGEGTFLKWWSAEINLSTIDMYIDVVTGIVK